MCRESSRVTDGRKRFSNLVEQLKPLLKILQESPPIDRLHDGLENVPGIYVFYDNEQPLYVGRTNKVRNRILAHTRESSGHNIAAFAFILAKKRAETLGIDLRGHTRTQLAKEHQRFCELFMEAKRDVAKMTVRFVRIEDPCTQSVFEVYAAMVLGTEHNVFDNH